MEDKLKQLEYQKSFDPNYSRLVNFNFLYPMKRWKIIT